MNDDMMQQYVKFVADHLLTSLRQPKLFRVENPSLHGFDFPPGQDELLREMCERVRTCQSQWRHPYIRFG